MNGTFEMAKTAYPIGYLRASEPGKCKIADMRTLEFIDNREVIVDDAVAIAHTANEARRAGQFKSNAEQTAFIAGLVDKVLSA